MDVVAQKLEEIGQKKKSEVQLAFEEIKSKVDQCWQLEKEITEETKETKKKKDSLALLEAELKLQMEEAGVTLAEGSESFYDVKEDKGFQAPQTVDGWMQFGSWIKETYGEQVYTGMFKVHAGTAKSFIGKEFEAKKDDPDFKIPGVPTPKPYTYIKSKKKK